MWWSKLTPLLSLVLWMSAGVCLGGDDHDHDTPKTQTRNPVAPPSSSIQKGPPAACSTSPQQLADFANGENYDLGAVSIYLSTPECAEKWKEVASSAILYHDVKFSSLQPFKLDQYGKTVAGADPLGALTRTDAALSKSFPGLLRQNPLSSTEILPILGQVSLLSPSAGRFALVNLIQQNLVSADAGLGPTASKEDKAGFQNGLALELLKMGVGTPMIDSALAQSVEEMALLSQADSLTRIFRSLAGASAIQPVFAPTFNLSAGALSRGVQRGKKVFSSDEKASLLKAVFEAVRASLTGHESLEAGSIELNDAASALLGQKSLSVTSLKALWKEVIKVCAETPTQPALASAVAYSLTPQSVYLSAAESALLLSAARNYPELATTIQQNFLLAWEKLRDDLLQRKIKTTAYNDLKDRFFARWVTEILDLGADKIEPLWLREVSRRGLVTDEDTERRFPRFMLAYLRRRDKAVEKFSAKSPDLGFEASLLAENLGTMWVLTQVYVPALNKWVKKYDE